MRFRRIFFYMTLWVVFANVLVCGGLYGAPSAIGATGGLLIPSPVTLTPETYEFGLHVEGFQETNMSTRDRSMAADISMKLNFGVYDNFEMGIEKMARSNSDVRDDQLYVQFKYRLPAETFNLSVGAALATGGRDYHSAYVVGGWKALYAGVGLNFGGRRLEELTLSTIRSFGTAKFGGYAISRVNRNGTETFVGAPEEFFALFGVDFNLSNYVDLLMDYDGDRFAAGFRINVKDLNFDLAYVSQAEIDSLFERATQHWQVGAGLQF